LVSALWAQAPQGKGKGPQPQAIKQIKPGLFLVTGAGGNSGVRVTREGVILIDGKLPGDENYNRLMELIKSVTDQPVKYLINTHHHQDHTGNNARFLAAGVPIIAHENLNKNLQTYRADPAPAPATTTYSKDYTVRLGGVEVQLHHYGRAHTSGDTVVYYPDLKVAQVSDVVTIPNPPLNDFAGGGSAVETIAVVDNILKLDFDTAIPGNGEAITRADVQTFRDKFNTLLTRARELVKNGVPKDQLVAQLKIDDLGWRLNLPGDRLDAFYAEISK
jgi:glyoxylase-like metal-dependent hydrolase (beta-lactamase superfamily II)